MKQGIKNLLIFTAGAVTGTVATAFACRSFYIKYYNETITDSINAELDSIRDSYDKKLDEMEMKYQANLLFEAGMATVKEEWVNAYVEYYKWKSLVYKLGQLYSMQAKLPLEGIEE